MIVVLLIAFLAIAFFCLKKENFQIALRKGELYIENPFYDQPINSVFIAISGYNYSKIPSWFKDEEYVQPIQTSWDPVEMVYYFLMPFSPEERLYLDILTYDNVEPTVYVESIGKVEIKKILDNCQIFLWRMV